MKQITIFEKEKDKLFAACFEPAPKDELDMALDFWRDYEGLRGFFMNYREDLSRFAPEMKVKDAVKQVFHEAEAVYDRLIEFSEQDNLDELFRPLADHEEEQRRYEFQHSKAKSGIRKGMLRIYAVKYRHWYVITGSAIKLTSQMNGRPHLKKELMKLERTMKLLQGGGPKESFVYLDME